MSILSSNTSNKRIQILNSEFIQALATQWMAMALLSQFVHIAEQQHTSSIQSDSCSLIFLSGVLRKYCSCFDKHGGNCPFFGITSFENSVIVFFFQKRIGKNLVQRCTSISFIKLLAQSKEIVHLCWFLVWYKYVCMISRIF